jgi:hypothetical protein
MELSEFDLVGKGMVDSSRGMKTESNKCRCYFCSPGFFCTTKLIKSRAKAKYHMNVETKLYDLPRATTHNTFMNTTCRMERNNIDG